MQSTGQVAEDTAAKASQNSDYRVGTLAQQRGASSLVSPSASTLVAGAGALTITPNRTPSFAPAVSLNNYSPARDNRKTFTSGALGPEDFASKTRADPVATLSAATDGARSSAGSYLTRGEAARTTRSRTAFTVNAGNAMTGLGVDLALSPRITVEESDAFRSTRAGAEVRIGQNLDLRGADAENPNWYVFAGADGEAVVWDMRQGGGMDVAGGAFTLQDKVTVGDMQAGISFEQAGTQMSVSYIQRDYRYENGARSQSGTEDFAALTLTWRR